MRTLDVTETIITIAEAEQKFSLSRSDLKNFFYRLLLENECFWEDAIGLRNDCSCGILI